VGGGGGGGQKTSPPEGGGREPRDGPGPPPPPPPPSETFFVCWRTAYILKVAVCMSGRVHRAIQSDPLPPRPEALKQSRAARHLQISVGVGPGRPHDLVQPQSPPALWGSATVSAALSHPNDRREVVARPETSIFPPPTGTPEARAGVTRRARPSLYAFLRDTSDLIPRGMH